MFQILLKCVALHTYNAILVMLGVANTNGASTISTSFKRASFQNVTQLKYDYSFLHEGIIELHWFIQLS